MLSLDNTKGKFVMKYNLQIKYNGIVKKVHFHEFDMTFLNN